MYKEYRVFRLFILFLVLVNTVNTFNVLSYLVKIYVYLQISSYSTYIFTNIVMVHPFHS